MKYILYSHLTHSNENYCRKDNIYIHTHTHNCELPAIIRAYLFFLFSFWFRKASNSTKWQKICSRQRASNSHPLDTTWWVFSSTIFTSTTEQSKGIESKRSRISDLVIPSKFFSKRKTKGICYRSLSIL
jgi:hypothetical protein